MSSASSEAEVDFNNANDNSGNVDINSSLSPFKANVLYSLIEDSDPVFLFGIGVALFIVLLTAVVLALHARSRKHRGILLVGLSDSGKTLLFSKLVYKKTVSTQCSLKENAADYQTGEKKKVIKLVDIPGHDRVRAQFLDKFKTTARGVIFVVDSVTFQRDVKDVAELLYTLLTDRTLIQSAPAFLVACNKHDQALAKGAKVIQSALEKELNSARVTKSASLQATDGTNKSAVFLGKHNQDFSFADVRPISVEFVECSARGSRDNDSDGVGVVQTWLARVA